MNLSDRIMEALANGVLGLVHRAFNNGRSYPEQQRHKRDQRLAERKTLFVEQQPAPLPSNRMSLSQASLSEYPQPSCLFLTTLPPEIRQRIYKVALGGNILRLAHISNGLAHQRYDLPNLMEGQAGTIGIERYDIDHSKSINWIDQEHLIPMPNQFAQNTLSLLLTCHTIYAEAIPVLYESNIFSVTSPNVLLYLKSTVPTQHFSSIRHLQLQWTYATYPDGLWGGIHGPLVKETWVEFWELVRGMELRSLSLWLGYWGRQEDLNSDAEFVRPLLRVKGIREVGVKVQAILGHFREGSFEELMRDIERQWKSPR